MKVATCTRCNAYVFAAEVDGCKVSVNMTPLDVNAYRAALLAGHGTYDQVDQDGRPWALKRRTAASQWPPFAGRKVLGDHACGTRGMNRAEVEVCKPSPKGPVRPYTGSSAACAPEVGTPARGVTLRRSETFWRCARCHREIKPDQLMWGIEVGPSRWAVHDERCP